jgi:hypothetical protein
LALTRWFAAIFILLVFVAEPIARSQSARMPRLTCRTIRPQAGRQLQIVPLRRGTGPSASQTLPVQSSGPLPTSEDQLKKQEKQRVFGVMATFNTTRNKDALPLSTGQKYQLFFKSATDPWPFLLAAFLSGIDQAEEQLSRIRTGDARVRQAIWRLLHRLLHRQSAGQRCAGKPAEGRSALFSERHRQLHQPCSVGGSGTVWCKRDNGTWGPNYANVVGNLMGAAVSNLYYPESDRTVGGTLERGFTVTAQAIIGSEVIEFWPDIVRHHRRKQAEKLARQGCQSTLLSLLLSNQAPDPPLRPPPPTLSGSPIVALPSPR